MENINKMPHIPVLLNEVIDSFKEIRDGIFIDCTLGYGGHSYNILQKYPNINLYGIDRDDEAIEFTQNRLKPFKNRINLTKGSFSEEIKKIDFNKVVGVLADFGVSSLQLDREDRGFRFDSSILDMRMDKNSNFSAKDVVNSYSIDELTRVFRDYGEAKDAYKVAKEIVKYREKNPIMSNKELTKIIENVTYKRGKTHQATTYFQAIRIEVNQELDEINKLLDTLEAKRPKGAIIALITFHSLEDRLVKQRFKKWAKKCICPPESFKCMCGSNNNLGVEINKKPISASKSEIASNPRSRSAKLRVFKFKD